MGCLAAGFIGALLGGLFLYIAIRRTDPAAVITRDVAKAALTEYHREIARDAKARNAGKKA